MIARIRPPKAARVQRPTHYVPADQHTLQGFQARLKAYAKAAEAQATAARGKVTALRSRKGQQGSVDATEAALIVVTFLLIAIALGVSALLLYHTGPANAAWRVSAAGAALFFLAALFLVWRDIRRDNATCPAPAPDAWLAPESQPSTPVCTPLNTSGEAFLAETETRGRAQFFWQPKGQICQTCDSVRIHRANTSHPQWRCFDGGFPTTPDATCPYWSARKQFTAGK